MERCGGQAVGLGGGRSGTLSIPAIVQLNPPLARAVLRLWLRRQGPATAGDYGVRSTEALFDPKTNLKTGTRHLKRLLQKYDNDYGRVIMAGN